MKEGHIYIYGIISPYQDKQADQYGEVNLKNVVSQLQANSKAEVIKVHIRSEGGDVNEGFAIHDALVNSGKEIHTIGEGIVASIATVIFLAGTTRSMSANAEFMVHNPWTWGEGNATALEEQAVKLREIEDKMVEFYASKTGSDAEQLRQLMNNETTMSADEAIKYNFATEIMQPLKAVALINTKNNQMNHEEFEQKMETKFEGLINKIAKFFSPKNLTLTTGDGKMLDFGDQIQEESEITVGMTATVDGAPAEGEYLMPTAKTFVFEAGELKEIKEPAEESEEDKLRKENDLLKAELEELKASNQALDQKNTEVTQALSEMKDEFVKIKAELKSDIAGFKPKAKAEDEKPVVNRFEKVFTK